MAEDAPPEVPPVLVRKTRSGEEIRYEIGNRVGKGGFGSVYYATELPANRPTAIKCIWKNHFSDPKKKQKIITEIEIHRSLRHRNIVEFRCVFQDEEYVYFALEYCPGGNVLELLKKSTPFSESQTANITRQILEALVYLHKNGIVHHDIKLQNFLIDSNGSIKLCDFGLSVRLTDDVKHSISGTPGYIPPEVVFSKDKPTPAIDTWSMGVAVFLMLTGKQPFQSHDKKETFSRIKHVKYAWPAKPIVSETAKSFVTAVLRREPEERPSSQNLLFHPFIKQSEQKQPQVLKTVPRSVSFNGGFQSLEDSLPAPITLPNYTVRIWWDYSAKYGLAYLLHNGICGACFNDATRMVFDKHETFVQYYDSPHPEKMEVIPIENMNSEHHLNKKLLLIQHFAKELKSRIDDNSDSFGVREPEQKEDTHPMGHVKYWSRTKDGILFRFDNRDIQANFKDHTKLIIESQTKDLYYDDTNTIALLNLNDLSDRAKYHEVRKRFKIVKEMAAHLV
ncbi:CAMK family protein kinase [Tritrichomonas foetus]|uniref:Serine/threonine-protein kinase PLK n=1 Tax=Tritrichomonas foetus TaxID=1144522 RepID=A0A1J4JNL1_9EUKA|nr:CAMK family protein kinase [Tritrichomonas foetus]|eukprot:OHT00719.1 CAMK family protein kinase [Tritrichomonas foetus]